MKKHKRKGKLFLENLEKRISTSPLLIQMRSAEGLHIVEKLRKLAHPNSPDLKMQQAAKSGLIKTKDASLSGDKFLNRVEKKQKNLTSMAISKEELTGAHKHKPVKTSDAKFVNRIVKKQQQLKKMAVSKEELSGIHKHKTGKIGSGEKFVNRIEQKQKNLTSMATSKKELAGLHKHKSAINPTVKQASGDKFVNRIVKKQKQLKSMAISKEDLARAHRKLPEKSTGWLGRLRDRIKTRSDIYHPHTPGT